MAAVSAASAAAAAAATVGNASTISGTGSPAVAAGGKPTLSMNRGATTTTSLQQQQAIPMTQAVTSQAIHSAALSIARGPGGPAALQAFLQTLAASKDKSLQQQQQQMQLQQQQQQGMDLTSIKPLASLGPPKQSTGVGLLSLPGSSASITLKEESFVEGTKAEPEVPSLPGTAVGVATKAQPEVPSLPGTAVGVATKAEPEVPSLPGTAVGVATKAEPEVPSNMDIKTRPMPSPSISLPDPAAKSLVLSLDAMTSRAEVVNDVVGLNLDRVQVKLEGIGDESYGSLNSSQSQSQPHHDMVTLKNEPNTIKQESHFASDRSSV